MSTKVNFAFLLLKENPIGRQMLVRFVASGYTPSLIVQEASQMAVRKRVAYEQCMQKDPPLPLVANLAEEHKIPMEEVKNHNGIECKSMLLKVKPDLILLGNARIIKPDIFHLAKHGCISVHPGLLPTVRGAFPVAWSIYYDQKVGCTCHFIDESIDTGAIIMKEQIPVYRGDMLEILVEKSVYVGAGLAEKALQLYALGSLSSKPQKLDEGTCYRWPSEEIIAEAKNKLATFCYSHFADTNRSDTTQNDRI